MLDALRGEGVRIDEGAKVGRVRARPAALEVDDRGRADVSPARTCWWRSGARPISRGWTWTRPGIETTRAGITVDARPADRPTAGSMPSATSPAGCNSPMWPAIMPGVVIRSMLFGLPAKARTDHIPWVTYTDPELAQVGLTEAEARDAPRRPARGRAVRLSPTTTAPSPTAGPRAAQGHGGQGPPGRGLHRRAPGGRADQPVGAGHRQPAENERRSPAMVSPYPTIGEVNKRAAGAYFSPRLFDNPMVKRVVGLVQKMAALTRDRDGMLNSLSGRFLILTIVFVMLAEVLIFVPSIARFREDYLLTRLERAQIASLALLADDMIRPSWRRSC